MPFQIFDKSFDYPHSGKNIRDYYAARLDEDPDPTAKSFYGLLSREGTWIIIRIDGTAKTIQYIVGPSAFDASWDTRTGLAYVDYDELFN